MLVKHNNHVEKSCSQMFYQMTKLDYTISRYIIILSKAFGKAVLGTHATHFYEMYDNFHQSENYSHCGKENSCINYNNNHRGKV